MPSIRLAIIVAAPPRIVSPLSEAQSLELPAKLLGRTGCRSPAADTNVARDASRSPASVCHLELCDCDRLSRAREINEQALVKIGDVTPDLRLLAGAARCNLPLCRADTPARRARGRIRNRAPHPPVAKPRAAVGHARSVGTCPSLSLQGDIRPVGPPPLARNTRCKCGRGGAAIPDVAGQSAAHPRTCSHTFEITTEPSPTDEATRFTEPARTSPTA
jgi:hypothetical protein